MASKKTKDEVTEDQAPEGVAAESAETDGQPQEGINAETDEPAGQWIEGTIESVAVTGLHERLEDAELTAFGKSPEYAHSLNRVTLLTGALKTALPEAIGHVEDEDLMAGLKALLTIL